MERLAAGFIKGMLIGFVVGIPLSGQMMGNSNTDGRVSCTLIIALIGGVIGIISSIVRINQEKEAQREEQVRRDVERNWQNRKDWAKETQRRTLQLMNSCKTNADQGKKPIVKATYKADSIMTVISEELAIASEIQGQIEALAIENER